MANVFKPSSLSRNLTDPSMREGGAGRDLSSVWRFIRADKRFIGPDERLTGAGIALQFERWDVQNER